MLKINIKKSVKGFTLLEVLLVVAIISILAGITILAINPAKQLGDSRNARRRSDVSTILNAIYQYSIDNNGDLTEISAGGELYESNTCDDLADDAIDLEDALAGTDATYLTDIPFDPISTTTSFTRYYVTKKINGRITVCAPFAENDATIEITR